MSFLEIVIVIVVTSAFIVPSFFIRKAQPSERLKGSQKLLRIFYLVAGVVMIGLQWISGQSIYMRIGISIMIISFVYDRVKDWLSKPKKRKVEVV